MRQRRRRRRFAGASTTASHVFFITTEQLAADDTDSSSDIYERYGGATTLISTGPEGGNGVTPACRPGGRFAGRLPRLLHHRREAHRRRPRRRDRHLRTLARRATLPGLGRQPASSWARDADADGHRAASSRRLDDALDPRPGRARRPGSSSTRPPTAPGEPVAQGTVGSSSAGAGSGGDGRGGLDDELPRHRGSGGRSSRPARARSPTDRKRRTPPPPLPPPPPPGEEEGTGGGGTGGGSGGGSGGSAAQAPRRTMAASPTSTPETLITFGPASKTRKRKVVFRFSDATGQPGTSFTCKVDRQRWKACGSPTRAGEARARPSRLRGQGGQRGRHLGSQPAKRTFKVVRMRAAAERAARRAPATRPASPWSSCSSPRRWASSLLGGGRLAGDQRDADPAADQRASADDLDRALGAGADDPRDPQRHHVDKATAPVSFKPTSAAPPAGAATSPSTSRRRSNAR